MSFTMKCPKCGQINDSDNIDYSTGYAEPETCIDKCYEFEFTCGSCNHEIYKGRGWGEFNLEDTIEEIKDYFSTDNKEEINDSIEKFIPIFGDSITSMGGINDFSEELTNKFKNKEKLDIVILGEGISYGTMRDNIHPDPEISKKTHEYFSLSYLIRYLELKDDIYDSSDYGNFTMNTFIVKNGNLEFPKITDLYNMINKK